MQFPVATWRWLLAGSFLLGAATRAQAQLALSATAPHGYDFLTVTTVESYRQSEAKMLLTPPFEGKSEVPLANGDLDRLTHNDVEKIGHNTLLINQQLSALTVAGWELVQVVPVAPGNSPGPTPPITRYLFRKPRP